MLQIMQFLETIEIDRYIHLFTVATEIKTQNSTIVYFLKWLCPVMLKMYHSCALFQVEAISLSNNKTTKQAREQTSVFLGCSMSTAHAQPFQQQQLGNIFAQSNY